MMARKAKLADVLGDEPATDTQTDTQESQEPAQTAPQSPRKKSQGQRRGGGSKTPQKRPQSPQEPAAADATVRATDTTEAKRVSVYLHPDDYRDLGMAKLEDGADLNARIRSMVALWRGNARFRQQVDRLAKSAPRGGGH